jgi:hypothetical protein
MTASFPALGRPSAQHDDTDRWRGAAGLRRQHRGWVIVWLARENRFIAYRQLPGARRDTALTDPTADGLSCQITLAERSASPLTGQESPND